MIPKCCGGEGPPELTHVGGLVAPGALSRAIKHILCFSFGTCVSSSSAGLVPQKEKQNKTRVHVCHPAWGALCGSWQSHSQMGMAGQRSPFPHPLPPLGLQANTPVSQGLEIPSKGCGSRWVHRGPSGVVLGVSAGSTVTHLGAHHLRVWRG